MSDRLAEALESAKAVPVSTGQALKAYKEGARLRNYEFAIGDEEADRLFRLPCHYCGYLPPNRFNGIDRVINNIGYVTGNVVPCCQWCNRAKGRFGLQPFLDWLDWVKSTPPGSKPRISITDNRARLRWHDVAVGGETIQVLSDGHARADEEAIVAPVKSEWRPPHSATGISMQEYVRQKASSLPAGGIITPPTPSL